MWNRHRLIVLVCLLTAGAACTQKAADATKRSVDTALEATKTGANKAIDATKAVGDKTADAAQAAADQTKAVVVTTGDAVTDTWITGKIKTKFADDTLLKGTRITIKTTKHVVTLSGVVDAENVKLRAGEFASGTPGVVQVLNHLVVR